MNRDRTDRVRDVLTIAGLYLAGVLVALAIGESPMTPGDRLRRDGSNVNSYNASGQSLQRSCEFPEMLR